MWRHTNGHLRKGQRKSAITGDMVLKNITAGNPCLNQKMGIEHQAAFVERISMKRATPTFPSPAPAESPFGPLSKVVGRECFATTKITINKQKTNRFRRCWLTKTPDNAKTSAWKLSMLRQNVAPHGLPTGAGTIEIGDNMRHCVETYHRRNPLADSEGWD